MNNCCRTLWILFPKWKNEQNGASVLAEIYEVFDASTNGGSKGKLPINEIQGLVGVKKDVNAEATYIHWACTAPHNNKHEFGKQKYEGVGGHLFAIAVDKSKQWGFDGTVHGFAANAELVKHYQEKFNAFHLGMLHEYQIVVEAPNAQKHFPPEPLQWGDHISPANAYPSCRH